MCDAPGGWPGARRPLWRSLAVPHLLVLPPALHEVELVVEKVQALLRVVEAKVLEGGATAAAATGGVLEAGRVKDGDCGDGASAAGQASAEEEGAEKVNCSLEK